MRFGDGSNQAEPFLEVGLHSPSQELDPAELRDANLVGGVIGEVPQRAAGALLDLRLRRVLLHRRQGRLDPAELRDADLVGGVGGEVLQRTAGLFLDFGLRTLFWDVLTADGNTIPLCFAPEYLEAVEVLSKEMVIPSM